MILTLPLKVAFTVVPSATVIGTKTFSTSKRSDENGVKCELAPESGSQLRKSLGLEGRDLGFTRFRPTLVSRILAIKAYSTE